MREKTSAAMNESSNGPDKEEKETLEREKLLSFLKNELWCIFRKYDMDHSNYPRINNVLEFCEKELREHPSLVKTLSDDKTSAEFFLHQSILYCIPLTGIDE